MLVDRIHNRPVSTRLTGVVKPQLVMDILVPAHDPRIGGNYMLNQNGNNF